jgi:hypothetical protein
MPHTEGRKPDEPYQTPFVGRNAESRNFRMRLSRNAIAGIVNRHSRSDLVESESSCRTAGFGRPAPGATT